MTVKIKGLSDDGIGVDGAIVEEFEYGGERDLLAFSDGTVLTVEFSPLGVWRILPVAFGTAKLTLEQALVGNESNRSDVATLDGPIAWVVHGFGFARADA